MTDVVLRVNGRERKASVPPETTLLQLTGAYAAIAAFQASLISLKDIRCTCLATPIVVKGRSNDIVIAANAGDRISEPVTRIRCRIGDGPQ